MPLLILRHFPPFIFIAPYAIIAATPADYFFFFFSLFIDADIAFAATVFAYY